jgi:DNA invertase Pin-like site-specific DNA recombinase
MCTTSSTGKLMLGVLASIAEFEADIRRERQREGIERAKAAGVYKGRKPSVDVKPVRELREQGLGGSAIAKRLGIGRASVYRALSS